MPSAKPQDAASAVGKTNLAKPPDPATALRGRSEAPEPPARGGAGTPGMLPKSPASPAASGDGGNCPVQPDGRRGGNAPLYVPVVSRSAGGEAGDAAGAAVSEDPLPPAAPEPVPRRHPPLDASPVGLEAQAVQALTGPVPSRGLCRRGHHGGHPHRTAEVERLLLPAGGGKVLVLRGARDDRPRRPHSWVRDGATARGSGPFEVRQEGRGDVLVPLHCADSWVLASSAAGGAAPEDTRLVRIAPLRFRRRSLHLRQPAKGGARRRHGGTVSLGLRRGTQVLHPRGGSATWGDAPGDCSACTPSTTAGGSRNGPGGRTWWSLHPVRGGCGDRQSANEARFAAAAENLTELDLIASFLLPITLWSCYPLARRRNGWGFTRTGFGPGRSRGSSYRSGCRRGTGGTGSKISSASCPAVRWAGP
jgi:hypothetical protein